MQPFVYDQPASRIVFGPGAVSKLPSEIQRLHRQRAIVLSTSGQRKLAIDAAEKLGELGAGVFAEAVMHVPKDTVRAACEAVAKLHADCCVAIGGGSTIGLAKAIALETGLPVVALPTTLEIGRAHV